MLARGSLGWVVGSAALAVVGVFAATEGWLPNVAVVLALPLAFVLHFFRDPDRTAGEGIVSPADGKVTAVETGGDQATIRIFMGPFDVHVNRAPLDAEVADRRHEPGTHRPAFAKDADTNERMVWTLATDHGPVELTQIAGAMARRILPYAEVGDALEKGDRLGIIRLGSRVDLALPGDAVPTVEVGDRVEAATTTIAEVD